MVSYLKDATAINRWLVFINGARVIQ